MHTAFHKEICIRYGVPNQQQIQKTLLSLMGEFFHLMAIAPNVTELLELEIKVVEEEY